MTVTSVRVFPKPVTYKYLDISSAHISKTDSELLQESRGIIAFPYDEGAFVHVPSDGGVFEDYLKDAQQGYSQAFCDLLEWAFERKCAFIRIDADGEEYPDLPRFGW